MKLAVFDVDGTLTQTNRVDIHTYENALATEFGISAVLNSLPHYVHVTDAGITAQIFQQHFSRAPSPAEIGRLQRRWVDLLRQAAATTPDRFVQVPGAIEALGRLQALGWAVAIATGSWRVTATVKLAHAGIQIEAYPAACSDDALPRPQVVATAISRAQAAYRCERFERVVSIGDGVWDVETAKQLDLPFVGISCERPAEHLRARGASHVVADFSDFAQFMSALEAADIPLGSAV